MAGGRGDEELSGQTLETAGSLGSHCNTPSEGWERLGKGEAVGERLGQRERCWQN